MSTLTYEISTEWVSIFPIPTGGYFVLCFEEQGGDRCAGSIVFLSSSNITDGVSVYNVSNRGINNYFRKLPGTFVFEDYPSRTYEMRNENQNIEVRIVTGTSMIVEFTLTGGSIDATGNTGPTGMTGPTGTNGPTGPTGPRNNGSILTGFFNEGDAVNSNSIVGFAYQNDKANLGTDSDLPPTVNIAILTSTVQVIPITGDIVSLIASCGTSLGEVGTAAAVGLYIQSMSDTTTTFALAGGIMRTDFTSPSIVGYQSSTLTTGSVPVTAGDRYTFVMATRGWSSIRVLSAVAIIN